MSFRIYFADIKAIRSTLLSHLFNSCTLKFAHKEEMIQHVRATVRTETWDDVLHEVNKNWATLEDT